MPIPITNSMANYCLLDGNLDAVYLLRHHGVPLDARMSIKRGCLPSNPYAVDFIWYVDDETKIKRFDAFEWREALAERDAILSVLADLEAEI